MIVYYTDWGLGNSMQVDVFYIIVWKIKCLCVLWNSCSYALKGQCIGIKAMQLCVISQPMKSLM